MEGWQGEHDSEEVEGVKIERDGGREKWVEGERGRQDHTGPPLMVFQLEAPIETYAYPKRATEHNSMQLSKAPTWIQDTMLPHCRDYMVLHEH